jgi:Flp pilus assembly protein TadD
MLFHHLTRVLTQAQSYGQRGMAKEAADAFDEVATIADDNPDAQYHAGMGHLQAGNLAKAKMRWRKCLEIDPQHSTARFNLATLTAEMGDIADATVMMREIVAQWPEPENHKTLAILLFKQEMHEEAISQFNKCTE